MDFIKKIKDNFNIDEPITIDEIRNLFNNYSKIRVAQLIRESVEKKELLRFDAGIYYIPQFDFIGFSSPTSDEVIIKKYLRNKQNVYGYYADLNFYNKIGISTQMPYVDTIISNNESSKNRVVSVGNLKVIVKKPRTKITNDNYKELEFLDGINSMDVDYLLDNKDTIKNYYINNINDNTIKEYINLYPAKTFKKIYMLELI